MAGTNSTKNLTLSTQVTLAFVMSMLALAIMLGNAVVILAFGVDKNLRHQSNYFFLNLAISDFFVVSESWKKRNSTDECEPGFASEWYVIMVTSFLEFLVPVILVAYFNIQIYWNLWKRGNLNRCLSHPGFIFPSSSDPGSSSRHGLGSRTSLSDKKEETASLHSDRSRKKNHLLVSFKTHTNSSFVASKIGSLSHSNSIAVHQKDHFELLRARKLAKSLAILLSAFTICWAPYSLSTIILSTYPQEKRPKTDWYKFVFWLQWFNSFINPFLYPLCHKRFRKAFLKIFRVKKQAILPHNRSISS
ncbi:histamine H4 receptor isoform 2-T2 [Thomomys bottae]